MRPLRFLAAALLRALRNLVEQRRLHLLSLTVMALSLSVLGGFLVIASNLSRARAQIGEERKLTAFVAAGVDDAGMLRLRDQAQAMSAVRSVELLTTAETSARFRTALGAHGAILDDLGDDVIPAALIVTAAPEISISAFERLAQAVGGLVGVEEVAYAMEELRRLSSLVRLIEIAALIVGGLIALVTVIVVSNTVRLTVMARHEEIDILKLVGATDTFVRLPFVFEGLLGGGVAGALAIGIVWGTNTALREALGLLSLGGIDATVLATLNPRHAVGLVGLGAMLGLLGGLIAVGRFLRTS